MSTPVIDSISPDSGSIKGGTTVIITGTNLSAVTAVTIGGNYATDLNIVSSTRIICTTPAGDVGTDDVVAIAGNYGTVWTLTSAPNPTQWSAVAMSSDGTYQTAVVYGGGIYQSSDFGLSWKQNESVSPTIGWQTVAMSPDGTYQTAGPYGGGIYQSSDSGKTWNANPLLSPVENWSSIAISSGGKYQTALAVDGQIYQSSYSGQTWTPNTSGGLPASATWVAVAMSSNGQIQTAIVNKGGVYQSSDSGENWKQNTSGGLPTTETNWTSVAMSSDGQIQTAVISNGTGTASGIYYSTDTGQNWTQNTSGGLPTTATKWEHIAMSSDGTYQTAVIFFAGTGAEPGIYTTTNAGLTWSQNTSATVANWTGVAMSSDGLYQTAVAYDGGLWTANAISSNKLDYTYEKIVISSICFPAGTPITTDQGNIPIDKINTEIHTIRNNPIVAITKTITQDTHLVCFEKHSLGLNKPNKKTITSKNHKVYYNGKMTKAYHFLKQFKNVTEVEYNGEILYNVLMEKYDKLKANNLTFETLDPKNIIAKLYTSNFDEEYKDNIIVMINHSIMQNDHRLYQNIINRVVNDKSLSTCFDEDPEYEYEHEEPEYEEPEYEEPVNTTRLDTIRNSAEKTYHAQSVNVKNKISLDNVTLHSKLTKYIKAQQSKDNQEAEVVQEEVFDLNFRTNLKNNVNLHSRLNKYAKMYQNKDNSEEIVKKKEFINLKKEEKERQEEKEEKERKESKMKASLAVVEKAKTYKRVQIFKKNGTSKRLF